MNTNKLRLLSLALLSTVAPALGMEEELKKNGTSSNNSIISKPTFGKLINKHVWGAIIGLKKLVAEQEISCELFLNILEDYLLNPKITLSAANEKGENTETALDDVSSKRHRANVALEFLADPSFEFLHSALLKLINESDLASDAFLLAIKLGYSEKVLNSLKPSISKAYTESNIQRFANTPTFEESDCQMSKELSRKLLEAGFKDDIEFFIHHLLTDDDLLKLARHLFSTKANGFDHVKKRYTLIYLKRVVIECGKRNLDLNFENEDGLTPLMWTNLSDNWLIGHSDALEDMLINSDADLNYKNKNGKTLKDLVNPESFEQTAKKQQSHLKRKSKKSYDKYDYLN